jgi:mannosyl-oligosaccharide alpha-1,2-mannosidase
MLRLRRYRVFMICAAVVVFLLFRVSQTSQWEAGSSLYKEYVGPYAKGGRKPDTGAKTERVRPKPVYHEIDDDDYRPAAAKEKEAARPPTETKKLSHPSPNHEPPPIIPIETPMPPQFIPDRKMNGNHDGYHAPSDDLHMMDPPGAKEESSLSATSTVHWEKQMEKFPVPEEEVIMLPTGKPKAMPRIQYKFGEEAAGDKSKREKRLASVKSEMKLAWDGYRKYAWGHDELSPVSKKYRDPFCGWAATLVDALDTLWIMGMKEEFDHAYNAVKMIDFTTTPYRTEIPVFETIIRYLGGLIAAYDVTGGKQGKYPALLEKAVELAEILMGVFDTPNRMPILYYNWKPAYASQQQRASGSVSIAELGSMSMEFTRLAQLTGKNKYYDAVARITDAFEDWQKRGTALNGIFPQQVDASGCNRTAQTQTSVTMGSEEVQQQAAEGTQEEPQGYQPQGTDTTKREATTNEEPNLEFQITPGTQPGEPSTGEFHDIKKRGFSDEKPVKKEKDFSSIPKADRLPVHGPSYPVNVQVGEETYNPYSASGVMTDWDCTAQGLTSGGYGMDQYSMGGSQDSAYEYFPKVWHSLISPQSGCANLWTAICSPRWSRAQVPRHAREGHRSH